MLRRVLLAGTMAAAAVLAACSSETGTPIPSTNSADTTTTPVGRPSAGNGPARAPQVTSPLDASKFVADPCAALTTDQLAGIALTDLHTKPTTAAGNPVCTWVDNTTSDSFGVTWMTVSANGLSGLSLDYAEKPDFAYFVPTTIGHYPAVFDSLADLRSQGQCSVSVGISNKLYFIALYNAESAATKSQACQFAVQAASAVIKNLGGS